MESLKYKTLRVGMKLLGVVSEVAERGLQVSLPNGLKGTVTRAEASEAFAEERARGDGSLRGKKRHRRNEVEEDEDEEDYGSPEDSEDEEE